MTKDILLAEGRALYTIATKFYTYPARCAEELGVSRQYFIQCMNNGIPLKYASYLGRKHKFNPAILCFKEYVWLQQDIYKSVYERLVKQQTIFSKNEMEYILDGKILNAEKFIASSDREIKK